MTNLLRLFGVVSYFCFLESSQALSHNYPGLFQPSHTGRRVRRQIDCANNGHFPDRPPEMCSVMYYSCSNSAGKWEKRWYSCARGEHYDAAAPTKCTPGPCLKKGKAGAVAGGKQDTPPEAGSAEEVTTTTTEGTTTLPPMRSLVDTDVLFSSHKLSWDGASSYCAKAKAVLLVIEDEEDNLFLNRPESLKKAPYLVKESVWSAAKFTSTDYEKLYWEPEHDKIENFKKNKNKNPLKFDWAKGEPKDDSESGDELCVDMKFSGGKTIPIWAASDCKEHKHFICVRTEEDRRFPKPDEDPIEEPVFGFPGSLTIRGVPGVDEKGIKLTGQLIRSNVSDYFYFYPDKRRLVPSPLLNEEDDPYNATYKPSKTVFPTRAINTLTIKTNGSVLPMSNNRMIIFVQEGKYAQGVFQPDSAAMSVTAVVSAMDGELLLTPEREIEFLAYDWHEVFTGPTKGKWRPEKIFEYADKPWAKAGHGVMKPRKDGQIIWEPDQKVKIPKAYDPIR